MVKTECKETYRKKISNKKLDGEINVNGRVFAITAFDNMIIVYENDESKSPSSTNLKAKSRTSDAITTTCILSPTLQSLMSDALHSIMCTSMTC